MTLHPRTMAVAQASADIGMTLIALQREHGLTDIEMLQALTIGRYPGVPHPVGSGRKGDPMTPGMFCGPVGHDWQTDPDHRNEGCICTICGVTEAELDAMESGETARLA